LQERNWVEVGAAGLDESELSLRAEAHDGAFGKRDLGPAVLAGEHRCAGEDHHVGGGRPIGIEARADTHLAHEFGERGISSGREVGDDGGGEVLGNRDDFSGRLAGGGRSKGGDVGNGSGGRSGRAAAEPALAEGVQPDTAGDGKTPTDEDADAQSDPPPPVTAGRL